MSYAALAKEKALCVSCIQCPTCEIPLSRNSFKQKEGGGRLWNFGTFEPLLDNSG